MRQKVDLPVNLIIVGTAALIAGLLAGRLSAPKPEANNVSATPKAIKTNKTAKPPKIGVKQGTTSSIADVSKIEGLFLGLNSNSYESLAEEAWETRHQRNREGLLGLVIEKWLHEDFDGALAFVQSISKDGGEGDDRLKSSLTTAGEINPDKAFEWIKNNIAEEAIYNELALDIYKGWARQDPMTVIDHVGAVEDELLKASVMDAAIHELVRQDPLTATIWIEQQAGIGGIKEIYIMALSAYIEQYPTEAGNMISEMQSCEIKSRLAGEYARQLAGMDPEQALQWSETLDSASQSDAIHAALTGLAGKDGQAVLAYLEHLPLPSTPESISARNELTVQAARNIALTQPGLLAGQIEDMPLSVRADVAKSLAYHWISKDLNATVDWVEQIDNQRIFDGASAGLTEYFQDMGMQAFALDFAQSITDEQRRTDMIEPIISAWSKTDNKAALAALDSLQLSPDQKLIILKRVNEVRTAENHP